MSPWVDLTSKTPSPISTPAALAGPRSYEGRMTDFPFVHPSGRKDAGPADIDAAIDIERLPGDPAGFVAGQVEGCLGNILRLSKAAQRPVRGAGHPQGIFVMNVSPEEFAAVSEANFLSPDVSQFFFTPTVVNTGSELILFDTGNATSQQPARGLLADRMREAGVAPENVDVVVITHMHGDHIGGLMGDGGAAFANAAYITGQTVLADGGLVQAY